MSNYLKSLLLHYFSTRIYHHKYIIYSAKLISHARQLPTSVVPEATLLPVAVEMIEEDAEVLVLDAVVEGATVAVLEPVNAVGKVVTLTFVIVLVAPMVLVVDLNVAVKFPVADPKKELILELALACPEELSFSAR